MRVLYKFLLKIASLMLSNVAEHTQLRTVIWTVSPKIKEMLVPRFQKPTKIRIDVSIKTLQ